jgi:hypothetical protein
MEMQLQDGSLSQEREKTLVCNIVEILPYGLG